MKIFMTGGSGLLGHYVRAELASGYDDTVVYDRVPDLAGELIPANTRLLRGDIRDRDAVLRAVADSAPDVIIHLASILAEEAAADPRQGIDVNCLGMLNVLEAAAACGVTRVVWASSASVFAGLDPGNGPIRDSSPYSPRTIYGATKVLCEQLGMQYRRERGVESVGLRLTLMVGPGKSTGVSGRISQELVEKPVRGIPAIVPYGDDIPNWLWVGDAASAIVLAARCDQPLSAAYNVGGDTRSLRDAVEIARELIPGSDISIQRGRFGLEHPLDTSGIEKDLGFHWAWGLEAQLSELVGRATTAAGRP